MNRGRPTDYKDEYAEQARKLCLLGFTDSELATFFEVCEATLNNWKIAHPNFLESIKQGKVIADGNVVDSLYKRAIGYEHDEVDIRVIGSEIVQTPIKKIYPPDATSLKFWLINRQKDKFREKANTEISGIDGAPIKIASATELTDDQLAAYLTPASSK